MLITVFVPDQSLTAMPECSTTPRRQRPDYLADFTSGSSADNSCSSTDEEEEERRKAGGGGGGRGIEKREKKVSYDLGESKEKNLAERSGKAAGCIKVSKNIFIRKAKCADFDRDVVSCNLSLLFTLFLLACSPHFVWFSFPPTVFVGVIFIFNWSHPSNYSG